MRKSFWIVLALLVMAGAPVAHADSFTYAYRDTSLGFSWTTTAISAVTMATTLPAADLTAQSTSGFTAGCTITSVTLDTVLAGKSGANETDFSGGGCGVIFVINGDEFTLTDYSTPGTYAGFPGPGTLVVTATPEPSSVPMTLLGVGILFVMWKRMGHNRPSVV